MSTFNDLLGSLRQDLPKVLGTGTLMLVLVGDLLFGMLKVYPSVRLHGELAVQLADARQALAVPASDAQVEANLKARLAKMETAFQQQANTFLAESDVAVVLNHLYRYADENGVQIERVEAASTAGPAAKDKGHDLQSFTVVVNGGTTQLISFVSSLQEAARPAVVIDQLAIKSAKGPAGSATLTMNLLLYTSAYATATASGTPAP